MELDTKVDYRKKGLTRWIEGKEVTVRRREDKKG